MNLDRRNGLVGNQAPSGDNVIVSVKKDKWGRKICKPATAATTAN